MPPPPRRIHITGVSGAGKSTLAAALARRLDVPLHHLDEIARHPATGVPRPPAERDALVGRIAAESGWVTDGVQAGWTDPLCERADLIVWLDHVRGPAAIVRVARRFVTDAVAELRVRRGLARVTRVRDYARHALALLRSMLEIAAYDRSAETTDAGSRGATRAQLRRYPDKVVHCRTARDIDRLLATIPPLPADDRSSRPVPSGRLP